MKVLVIDDNEDYADSLAMLTKHGGHLVPKAFNAAERISVAAGFSWITAMPEAHRSVFRWSGNSSNSAIRSASQRKA